jgi:hypothetical protein
VYFVLESAHDPGLECIRRRFSPDAPGGDVSLPVVDRVYWLVRVRRHKRMDRPTIRKNRAADILERLTE